MWFGATESSSRMVIDCPVIGLDRTAFRGPIRPAAFWRPSPSAWRWPHPNPCSERQDHLFTQTRSVNASAPYFLRAFACSLAAHSITAPNALRCCHILDILGTALDPW